MMENKQAIVMLKYSREIFEKATLYSSCEAIDLAIAVLERQNKEPCEHCADLGRYKSFTVELFHQVAADDIYEISVDVNYCPNCGRDLRESEG